MKIKPFNLIVFTLLKLMDVIHGSMTFNSKGWFVFMSFIYDAAFLILSLELASIFANYSSILNALWAVNRP